MLFDDFESAVEADLIEAESSVSCLTVILRPTGKPNLYDVWMAGRKIVSDSPDPEFDACRYLKARGCSGRLETYRDGKPYPCMILDIDRAASLRTDSNSLGTPVFRKYRHR